MRKNVWTSKQENSCLLILYYKLSRHRMTSGHFSLSDEKGYPQIIQEIGQHSQHLIKNDDHVQQTAKVIMQTII